MTIALRRSWFAFCLVAFGAAAADVPVPAIIREITALMGTREQRYLARVAHSGQPDIANTNQFVINCAGKWNQKPSEKITMQIVVEFTHSKDEARERLRQARWGMQVSPVHSPRGLGDLAYLFQGATKSEDPRFTGGTMLFVLDDVFVSVCGEPGTELWLLPKQIEQIIIKEKKAKREGGNTSINLQKP